MARMDENFLLISRDLAEFLNNGWAGVRVVLAYVYVYVRAFAKTVFANEPAQM